MGLEPKNHFIKDHYPDKKSLTITTERYFSMYKNPKFDTPNKSIDCYYAVKDRKAERCTPILTNKISFSGNTNDLNNERFKAATTIYELETQLKDVDWLKNKIRDENCYLANNVSTEEIAAFSKFLQELNKLPNEKKEELKYKDIFDAYYYETEAEKRIENAQNFSVENLLRVNPKILELLKKEEGHFLFSIQEPNLVNQLYNLIDNKFKYSIFKYPHYITDNKEKLIKYIQRAEILNKLDKIYWQGLMPTCILHSTLTVSKLKKNVEYLNGLTKYQKAFANLHQLANKMLNARDYSWSISRVNEQQNVGTKHYKVLTSKKELIDELAKTKDGNGIIAFNNDEIKQIVNSENNIIDISNALHLLQSHKSTKNKKEIIKFILKKEGLDSKELAKRILNLEKIQAPNIIIDYNDNLIQKILTSSNECFHRYKNNMDVIKLLIESQQNQLKMDNKTKKELEEILFNNLISVENFKQLININLFDSVNLEEIKHFLVHTKELEKITQKHIELIKYFKTNQDLQNIMSFENQLKLDCYRAIAETELNDNFDLNKINKKIGFIKKIKNDENLKNKFGDYFITKILINYDKGTNEDAEEILEKIMQNSYLHENTHHYFTKYSHKESLNYIKSIESNPILNKKNNFYLIANTYKGFLDEYLKIMEYVATYDSLKDIESDAGYLLRHDKEYQSQKDTTILNLEKTKPKIDKLANIQKHMSPKLWERLKSVIFDDILILNTNLINYKIENIKYFSQIFDDPAFDDITIRLSDEEITNLLCKNLNLEEKTNNLNKLLETNKILDNLNIEKNNDFLLNFDGNLDKLTKKCIEMREKHPNDFIKVSINELTSDVIFNIEFDYLESYNKEMELNWTTQISSIPSKCGGSHRVSKIKDFAKKQEHKIVKTKQSIIDFPSTIVSKYYDDKNRLLKTKVYEETSFDGALRIKEYTPNGKLKRLCQGYSNANGDYIRKNLTSIDGTRSNIFYHKTAAGEEIYTYIIKDKNDNELLNQTRTFKIIDETTRESSINDKKYKMKYFENKIQVTNEQNGEITLIDLNKLNPTNEFEITNLFKTIAGDELIKANKLIESIEFDSRLQSSFNKIAKKLKVGANKFVLEHELGHAKDTKIMEDKNLQKIYLEERALMLNNVSQGIYSQLDYFINTTNTDYQHLFGLSEVIAEANAIQTTAQFYNQLQLRTHLLQEYFPRTIAYLIKNHLT